MESRGLVGLALLMVERLKLGWWPVADGAVQAPLIPPVDVWVPSLILQPLVENAVVHGLAGHQGRVMVRIAVQMTNDVLTLSIVNTLAPDKLAGEEGIGLNNVRERLVVQFEGRAGLTVGGADGEWCSEIIMPAIHHSPAREKRPIADLVSA